MKSYIAAFLPEQEGGYSVLFPDLPGCNSCGDDLQESFAMSVEALAGHLQALADDGDPIPDPSGLEEAHAKLKKLCEEDGIDFPSAPLLQLVPAPDLDDSLVRVSVSFRRYTLNQIDRKAEEAGLSRSGFLAAAAATYTPRSRA